MCSIHARGIQFNSLLMFVFFGIIQVMEKEQLDELLELTRENHKILRGMQRYARFNRLLKMIYWVIIIGSLYGTYYYIQPYVDQVLKIYSDVASTVQSVKSKALSIPDPSSLKLTPEMLKQLQSKLQGN